MERIRCSDWLPEWARWAHFTRFEFPALIPRKKKKNTWGGHSGEVHNFWTTSAIELQRAADGSQNEGNINGFRWYIALYLLFFPRLSK